MYTKYTTQVSLNVWLMIRSPEPEFQSSVEYINPFWLRLPFYNPRWKHQKTLLVFLRFQGL